MGAVLLCGSAAAQSIVRSRLLVKTRAGDTLPADSALLQIDKPERRLTTDRNGNFETPAFTGTARVLVILKSGDSAAFYLKGESPAIQVLVADLAAGSNGEVRIEADRKGAEISGRGLQKTELLNENEFKKAACCTLSESFETTNTVEVSNADGVSGIRQVEMLGLASRYVMMTRDNMPVIRGLSVLTGLNQIPGPMVGGVHISKGTGSVSSGYEGLTGGINYGLKADPKDPRLFLNAYINNQLRGEANLVVKSKINPRTYNFGYLHYGGQWRTMDQGGDGFTDMPLTDRVMVADQVNYFGKKYELVAGVSHVDEQRRGGDVELFHGGHLHPHPRFRFDMREQKSDAYLKFGYFLNEDGSRSIGQILNVTNHKTTATLNSLRNRRYEGLQRSLNYAAIYGSPDEKTWSTRSGINLMYDDVSETLRDSGRVMMNPERQELNAGIFGEVVRKTEKTTWLLGLRADYNNLYGWLITPRFHGKISLGGKRSLHIQVGRGVRTPWILTENLPLLISNRRIEVRQPFAGGAYGQQREDAINGGISYVHPFMMFGYPATFSADVFRTYFFNQVIADRDEAPDRLLIRGTSGNFSQIAQADLQFLPHRRFEVKLSYRFVQTMQLTGGAMRWQTMQSPHRALGVFSFHNRKKWYFDAIVQWNSGKRLPRTELLPETERRFEWSPSYVIVNTQIRKDLGKTWELYGGVENLLNVIQKNPVLSAENPHTPWFDAAFAWGPVNGITAFAGFRLKIR